MQGPKPGIGYAHVEPCEGEWVEGALYLVTEEQLRKLDKYEGVPRCYKRSAVKVWNIDRGEWIDAVTYLAVRRIPA